MNIPLVSIVIPVFNQRTDFLVKAIESACEQTFTDIEIIISDNHSDLCVKKIVDEIVCDMRIRFVKPDTHLTMSEHFKFAFSLARGKYIAPLCSDDEFDMDHIEELIKPFSARSDVSFTCSAPFQAQARTAAFTSPNVKEGFYGYDDFLFASFKEYICSFGAILISVNSYNEIKGINTDIAFAFDVDLIFRLAKIGTVHFTPKKTAFIRLWERDEQRSRQYVHLIDLQKIFALLETSKMRRSTRELFERKKEALLYYKLKRLPFDIYSKREEVEEIEKIVKVLDMNKLPTFVKFIIRYRSNNIIIIISILLLILRKVKMYLGKYLYGCLPEIK